MGVYFFLHICTGRFSWWGCDAVRYGNRGKVSKLCCLDGRDLEKDFFTIIFSMRLSLCTDFEEYKIILEVGRARNLAILSLTFK